MFQAILIVVSLLIGAGGGYSFFRYVLKKKYLRMIDTANKEADVIKEKKLLEVLQNTNPIFVPIGVVGSLSKCPIVDFSLGRNIQPQEFPE